MISQWSSVDVLAWLKEQNLDLYKKYSENFLVHDIDGGAILNMNEFDVKNIGVVEADDRKLFVRLFMILKMQNMKEQLEEFESSSRKNQTSNITNI